MARILRPDWEVRFNFRTMDTPRDKLWKSKITGRATKVKMFNSNVKAVLLEASELWTITQRTTDRIQVLFIITNA